jgi:hypothetical protein
MSYDNKTATPRPTPAQRMFRKRARSIGRQIRNQIGGENSFLHRWFHRLGCFGRTCRPGCAFYTLTKNMTHRLLKLSVAIIILGFAYFAYLYWLDGTIIQPIWNEKNQMLYTQYATYHAGDEIFANSPESCKLRDIPATRIIYLQDDYRIELTPEVRNLGTGCRIAETDVAQIPTFAMPGVYHLEGTFNYQVNPLRKISIPFKSNDFTIIPYEGFIK